MTPERYIGIFYFVILIITLICDYKQNKNIDKENEENKERWLYGIKEVNK